VAATAAGVAAVSIPAQSVETDVAIVNAGNDGSVPDRYIVRFKNTHGAAQVRATAADKTRRHGGRVRHNLEVIDGYSATMTEQQAKALAKDPDVAYVQQAHYMVALDTQTNPPNWGDDRIDQRDLPLNSSFTYPTNAGQGARVYILDSGINPNHADFAGRVAPGFDFVDDDTTPTDCHGHGTHVAGTAVGTTYGIAKKATVSAVRALDCAGSGTSDDIIAAINWIKTNAVKPAVVNYSVGCRARCSDVTMDNAVKSLIASGVQFVQAAGNSNDDACFYSPQLVPEAITVGNSTNADAKASTSSYGTCLDIWAPGTTIVSAAYNNNTGSATMSGTSMASPHVTGAAAVYLGQNPTATAAQVRDALVNNSTPGKITGLTTASPNRLLYTGFMNTTPPVSVVNPGGQSGTVGVAVNRTNSATGGSSPYTWSATGLPAGLSINSSTGTITGSPSAAGTSNVTVTATDSASRSGSAAFGWTVVAAGGCSVVSNGNDFAIADNATVESPVTVSGCSGNASASATVDVDIKHTYISDLIVSLIAPDGSAYVLHNRAGEASDDILKTYAVDLSSEGANGTWKLRVQDLENADTGTIDSWSLNTGSTASSVCAPVTNDTDVPIPDNATVESTISLPCTGNGSESSTVKVSILHTWRGDLKVDLVTSSGLVLRLKNAASADSADNVITTYSFDLSEFPRAGTWKLRVTDTASNDTGTIDTWTLTT
jgi:subtilisin-like proprotein convertase family protein/subtilisin family serine protease